MTLLASTLKPYAARDWIYVETGLEGGCSLAMAIQFGANPACSCDIKLEHVESMKKRFADYGERVRCEQGDSPAWLAQILPTLPAGFLVVLLDAHGPHSGPMLSELRAIKESGRVPDVLLIDDWRYVRIGYWGFGESDVWELIHSIYGPATNHQFLDGDGEMVDVLNGPATGDVLEVIR